MSKVGISASSNRGRGHTQPPASTSDKARNGGKSLEEKVSELAADCAINSTRILEISSNQNKGISSSTVNSASLIEMKREVKESLDANSTQFKDFQKQYGESLDANSSQLRELLEWRKQVMESLDANSSKMEN